MGKPYTTYTAGDGIDAADLNNDYENIHKGVLEIPCAEAINSTSAPIPVYIKPGNGWVGICDADLDTAHSFYGFALKGQNKSAGEFIQVVCLPGMIVGGFSGLDRGQRHYIQTDGSLGTSAPATGKAICVGYAISTTELIIERMPIYAVLNYGSLSTTGRVAAGGATHTKDFECGFIPREIEAIVITSGVYAASWSASSNQFHQQNATLFKGILGQSFWQSSVTNNIVSSPPNAVHQYHSPYYDEYYEGTQNRPSFAISTSGPQIRPYGSGDFYCQLTSITIVNNTTLRFTWTCTGADDGDLRYGLKMLNVRE